MCAAALKDRLTENSNLVIDKEPRELGRDWLVVLQVCLV
jgi:hypothetical protein